MSGTSSSRRPVRPSARRSRGCPARCSRLRSGSRPRSTRALDDRHGQQAFEQRVAFAGVRRLLEFLLDGLHVDEVVVQRVHVAAVGDGTHAVFARGARMRDLLLEHRVHQVRHRPHALADLRARGRPSPASTLLRSYDWIHADDFMSPLRIIPLPSRCASRRRCDRGSRC